MVDGDASGAPAAIYAEAPPVFFAPAQPDHLDQVRSHERLCARSPQTAEAARAGVCGGSAASRTGTPERLPQPCTKTYAMHMPFFVRRFMRWSGACGARRLRLAS
jgi:hypothetical protein